MTKQRPCDQSALYWSEQGEVCCEKHAPFRGSDTWVFGRWRKITRREMAEILKVEGSPRSCEVCK